MKRFGQNHIFYDKLSHFLVPGCSNTVKLDLIREILNHVPENVDPVNLKQLPRITQLLDYILIDFPLQYLIEEKSQHWLLSRFLDQAQRRVSDVERLLRFDGVNFVYHSKPNHKCSEAMQRLEIKTLINQKAPTELFKCYPVQLVGNMLILKLWEMKSETDIKKWNDFSELVYQLMVPDDWLDFHTFFFNTCNYKSIYLFYFILQLTPTNTFKKNHSENMSMYYQYFMEWKSYLATNCRILISGMKRLGFDNKNDPEYDLRPMEVISDGQISGSRGDSPFYAITIHSLVFSQSIADNIHGKIGGTPISLDLLENISIHCRLRLLYKLMQSPLTSAQSETLNRILMLSPNFGKHLATILSEKNNENASPLEKSLYWVPHLFAKEKRDREALILTEFEHNSTENLEKFALKLDLEVLIKVNSPKTRSIIETSVAARYGDTWKQINLDMNWLMEFVDPSKKKSKMAVQLAILKLSCLDLKQIIPKMCEFAITSPLHIPVIAFLISQWHFSFGSHEILLEWCSGNFSRGIYLAEMVPLLQYYHRWCSSKPMDHNLKNFKKWIMKPITTWEQARFLVRAFQFDLIVHEWTSLVNYSRLVDIPTDLLDLMNSNRYVKLEKTE